MSIDSIIERINKLYGAGTIVRASDAIGAKIKFFSTGSAALDIALCGGFPRGRMIEVSGEFSSTKTTLSCLAGKEFLKSSGPDAYVAHVDVEGTFDVEYLKYLVGRKYMDRFLLVNSESGEKYGDVIHSAIEGDDPGLWIIDSLASLIPNATIEKSAEAANVGVFPRLVNRILDKIRCRMKRNLLSEEQPITLLILNQTRMKIGVMFGDPTTSPGGKGKDFYASQIIRLTPHEKIKEEIELPNGKTKKNTVGVRVGFKIPKNKCGGPQDETGEYTFFNRSFNGRDGGTIDNCEAVFHYGLMFGIIKPVKWGKNKRDAYEYQGEKAKTAEDFQELLREDSGLYSELYATIMAECKRRFRQRDIKEPKAKKKKGGLIKRRR